MVHEPDSLQVITKALLLHPSGVSICRELVHLLIMQRL